MDAVLLLDKLEYEQWDIVLGDNDEIPWDESPKAPGVDEDLMVYGFPKDGVAGKRLEKQIEKINRLYEIIVPEAKQINVSEGKFLYDIVQARFKLFSHYASSLHDIELLKEKGESTEAAEVKSAKIKKELNEIEQEIRERAEGREIEFDPEA